MKYARIIVDNRAVETDRPFTYIIPEEFLDYLEVGMRVIIPFGRGNKTLKGLVIKIDNSFQGNYRLKEIIDVIDEKPLVGKELLSLGFWLKDNYLSSYLDALQLVLPPGNFKEISTYITYKGGDFEVSLSQDEKSLIGYLEKKPRVELEEVKKDLNIAGLNRLLSNLEDKGLVKVDLDIRTSVSIKTEVFVRLSPKDLSIEEKLDIIGSRAFKQRQILEFMEGKKFIRQKDLLMELDTTTGPVKALENLGFLELVDRPVNREALEKEIPYYKKHTLNPEQEGVFKTIIEEYFIRGSKKFLLHGVTGSGKTEIYLQLVEEMLSRNKDSIILVPEISLTPQTIDRFVGRFGEDVAILHSRLSKGQRFDEWRKINNGEVKIVVGARSAIFAPFKNLGLIIIDEEHETSYKSSQNPKYITREVAEKRSELEGSMVLLGSATPSVDTYYLSRIGEYRLLEMKDRVNKEEIPEIEIVDMREELELGNRSIFSRDLYLALKENLARGRQSILFLNRRGFSTFVSCRSCGYVVECDSCDVAMTYHRSTNLLKCHYCGKTKQGPSICPNCNSKYIKYFGIGTEKIEEISKSYFPQAKIARMDTDTMNKRQDYETTLNSVKSGEIDILIGTQMISKGLDFENVTLVGIVAADVTLNLPDFRSAERTFQLATQVGGRSGRGSHKGRIILQTYEPDHYSIESSKRHDYKAFYEREIGLRREFSYPPFVNMINILVYGEDKELVLGLIKRLSYFLISHCPWLEADGMKNYIGPYPSPIAKINKNYRWQFIMKLKNSDLEKTKEVINKVCIENIYKLDMDSIKLSVDINPYSVL